MRRCLVLTISSKYQLDGRLPPMVDVVSLSCLRILMVQALGFSRLGPPKRNADQTAKGLCKEWTIPSRYANPILANTWSVKMIILRHGGRDLLLSVWVKNPRGAGLRAPRAICSPLALAQRGL